MLEGGGGTGEVQSKTPREMQLQRPTVAIVAPLPYEVLAALPTASVTTPGGNERTFFGIWCRHLREASCKYKCSSGSP